MKRARPASPSRTELPDVRAAARAPTASELASATVVVLNEEQASSVARLLEALPQPEALLPGTLIVVPGDVQPKSRGFAQGVWSAFARPKTIARAVRCTALLAKGFVEVGSGTDERERDLAWASAPRAAQVD